MKKYLLLVLGLLLVFTGCHSKKDTLATFTGGEVTRGELYNYIETSNANKDAILKSKRKQDVLIKNIALNEIVVMVAKEQGLDQTEKFKIISDFMTMREVTNAYIEQVIKKDNTKVLPIADVQMIVLNVKNYKIENNKRVKLDGAELEKAVAVKVAEAKTIINEYKNDADFSELAAAKSDHFSKRDEGRLGYISKKSFPAELSEKIFALKEGTITEEPIVVGNRVYIVKLNDLKDITLKKVEKVVKEKRNVVRISRELTALVVKEKTAELEKSGDCQFNKENILVADRSKIVFKAGEKVYSGAEIDSFISVITNDRLKLTKDVKKDDENYAKIEDALQKFYEILLLVNDAEKEGIADQKEVVAKIAQINSNILMNQTLDKMAMDLVKITDDDVKKEYAKNKKTYVKRMKKNGKNIKKQLSFSEAKDQIKMNLVNRQKRVYFRMLKKQLLEKYGYQIYSEELEGE